MIRSLGQDLSIEEIKELLGLEVTAPSESLSVESLDSILEDI